MHPDLPGLGVIGQFARRARTSRCSNCRPAGSSACGPVTIPLLTKTSHGPSSRRAARPRPHNVLALTSPKQPAWRRTLRAASDLAEPLLFGPMLPPRYRLDGPGAVRDAAAAFREQLAAAPRPPVEPDDVAALADVGFDDLLPADLPSA